MEMKHYFGLTSLPAKLFQVSAAKQGVLLEIC